MNWGKMAEIEIRGSQVSLNLTINNKKLAEIFDDVELNGRVDKFTQLIEAALAARSAFLVDLETQTIKKSVESAIESLENYYEDFKVELGKNLEDLTNPETGKFSETFGEMVDSTLVEAMDPFSDDANRPLTQLRVHLDEVDRRLRDYIEPMRQKLGINSSKPPGAGDTFESVVSTILENQAGMFGDVPKRDGDSAETGTTRKIGDLRIEIPSALIGGRPVSIDFEMKTDQRFKLLDRKTKPNLANDSEILKAIDDMLSITQSDAAVFVLDDDLLEMENQVRWKVLGPKKLLIVVNRIAPSPEYLQLAYVWARWQATQALTIEKQTFDKKDFDERLTVARDGLESTGRILTKLTRSVDGINEAKSDLDTMRNAVKRAIQDIIDDLADQ
jgi:hypothetical protein